MRPDPDASIFGGEHGLRSIASQTLLHGNRRDGELSKAVESSRGGNPHIAFAIFKDTEDYIARQAIGFPEYICAAVMNMDEAPLYGSDPEAARPTVSRQCFDRFFH